MTATSQQKLPKIEAAEGKFERTGDSSPSQLASHKIETATQSGLTAVSFDYFSWAIEIVNCLPSPLSSAVFQVVEGVHIRAWYLGTCVLASPSVGLLPVLCGRGSDLPLFRCAKLQSPLAEPPWVDEEAHTDPLGQEVVNAHNAIYLAPTGIAFSVAEIAHLSV